MTTITVHRASDGTDFDTKESCTKHEEDLIITRLCGLMRNDVVEAIDGDPGLLSAALEWAGNKAATARRARGKFNRVTKVKAAAE